MAHPNGITYEDVEYKLGWHRQYFYKINRVLCLMLEEEGEEFTVANDSQGQGEPWLYWLTGSARDMSANFTNRFGDTLTRMETMHAKASCIVNSSNANGTHTAIERLRARRILKNVGRLMEDLDELTAEAEALGSAPEAEKEVEGPATTSQKHRPLKHKSVHIEHSKSTRTKHKLTKRDHAKQAILALLADGTVSAHELNDNLVGKFSEGTLQDARVELVEEDKIVKWKEGQGGWYWGLAT